MRQRGASSFPRPVCYGTTRASSSAGRHGTPPAHGCARALQLCCGAREDWGGSGEGAALRFQFAEEAEAETATAATEANSGTVL